jgi:hypothetical protein
MGFTTYPSEPWTRSSLANGVGILPETWLKVAWSREMPMWRNREGTGLRGGEHRLLPVRVSGHLTERRPTCLGRFVSLRTASGCRWLGLPLLPQPRKGHRETGPSGTDLPSNWPYGFDPSCVLYGERGH